MDWKLLLGSSVIGAVVGAFLKAFWDRRAAKMEPKTVMRAEAYRDFIVYVVRMANGRPISSPPDTTTDHDFHEIYARLLLFGESGVVDAAAGLVDHNALDSQDAKKQIGLVVQEMRKSLLTRHGGAVVESAQKLVYAKPWT